MSALLAIALMLAPALAQARAWAEASYTRAQYRWAVRWINGPLETLMANGIIETIAARGEGFDVRAGDGWSRLSFSEAGEIIKDLSRARQITGHSPFFTVTQGEGTVTVGRVTRDAITVYVPGEGAIDYFPDPQDRENTVY